MVDYEKLEQELAEFLDRLPAPDGWFDPQNRVHWLALGRSLLARGMPFDETRDLLTRAYWAAIEQYGG